MRYFQHRTLGIVCLCLFVLFLFAQMLTGWTTYNNEQRDHKAETVSLVSYVTSGDFYEATFENWESEFLQMAAFVLLTVFFLEKGSSESKKMKNDPHDEDPRKHKNDPHAPWPVRKGGWVLHIYENSLFIAFTLLFLGAILGHAIGGAHEYSSEALAHGGQPITTLQFVKTSEFWFQSFQNWQSEFLAVASIVYLSIYLRQKGSPESKAVFEPNRETGD